MIRESRANHPVHHEWSEKEMQHHQVDVLHQDLLYSPVEIAAIVGVCSVTVSNWLTKQHEGRMNAR